jgi:hypothetical protein
MYHLFLVNVLQRADGDECESGDGGGGGADLLLGKPLELNILLWPSLIERWGTVQFCTGMKDCIMRLR